ncbi:MAG: hypothetical protein PVJ75_13470, partial [Chloroflexota bacterium]
EPEEAENMIDFNADRFDPIANQTDRDWGQARRKVLYQRVVCAVTQCSVDMMSFGQVKKRLRLGTPHNRGLQRIPLEQVKGSVGRHEDFTSTFLPRQDFLQDRWIKVEKLMLAGKAPPIDVYKVGDAYFVVDGNHRVSVGRQLGLDTIEAYVTEFETPFDLDPNADIDRLFIEAEQAEFMRQVGESNAEKAGQIVLSCAGCYRDLGGQIDAYRAGMEARDGRPVTAEEAFAAWHSEVYETALKAVRQEGLMNMFPERTAADLFVWSWQNSQALEAAVAE